MGPCMPGAGWALDCASGGRVVSSWPSFLAAAGPACVGVRPESLLLPLVPDPQSIHRHPCPTTLPLLLPPTPIPTKGCLLSGQGRASVQYGRGLWDLLYGPCTFQPGFRWGRGSSVERVNKVLAFSCLVIVIINGDPVLGAAGEGKGLIPALSLPSSPPWLPRESSEH